MAPDKKQSPEFFEDSAFDPVHSAIGKEFKRDEERRSRDEDPQPPPKKKAGFYLSMDVLERFNRKFHELKLAGVDIENKSALLEGILTFALNDLDQGEDSQVLKIMHAR